MRNHSVDCLHEKGILSLPAFVMGACYADPQAVLAVLLCGLDVAATGVLIASKQLKLLVRAMTLTLALVAAFYQWRRPAGGHSLGGVWWGLLLFFAARVLQSTAGMLRISQPSSPQAARLTAADAS